MTAQTSSKVTRREDAARRICNLVPSRDTARDWSVEVARAAGALAALSALPASVDLREDWWSVGDQGRTGSCVGWASAEGVVRFHMVKAERLSKVTMLSPRYVWMASKETDEATQRPETFVEQGGTSLKAAMDVCRKYGVVTGTLLPFQIETLMYAGPENAFYAEAAKRRISAYFNLKRNLGHWKTWLATQGPVLAGLSVDRAWDEATATRGVLDEFDPETVRGGHAVAVVGYTASGRFILRNSWGTGWGDRGFAYASPEYVEAAFFGESYGVTV